MADAEGASPAGDHFRAVEHWNEGDFELDGRDIYAQAVPAADVSPHDPADDDDAEGAEDWDKEFEEQHGGGEAGIPSQGGDDDEDQADTIKLSSAAGSALKLLIDAQRSGQGIGTITHLGGAGCAMAPEDPDIDWDADLEIPDSLPFDMQALRLRKTSFTSDVDGDQPSASASTTTTSTSYKSNLGVSTDFTDPESSPRKTPSNQSSTSSADASSLLCPPYQFRGRGDAASLGHEADSETDLEHDFELEPGLEQLSLSPAVSRQRSRATLDQERLLWGDDAHARSPSPGLDGGLSRARSHSSNLGEGDDAAAHLASESDADDEHEDPLDGLVLEGSVFEMDDALPSSASAGAITKSLEAMLDMKRAGETAIGSAPQRHDGPIESEADLAGGLVITDDLDLSPSRLSSNKLSFRTRTRATVGHGPSQLGRGHLIRHPSLPASTTTSSTLSQNMWSSRDSSAGRLPPLSNLSVPSRSEIFSPSSRQRTLSQLSSGTSVHLAAEPGPSQSQSASRPRVPRGRGLQYKRSASDLQQKAADSPVQQRTARTQGLARKRSLPSLADRFKQQSRAIPAASTSSSATGSTVSRVPSSFSSRLTASTAASRARAAETAADILARMARDSPPPPLPGGSPAAPARGHASTSRFLSRARPSTADDSSPSRRPRSPHPLRQGRVSSPLVQYPSAHFFRRTAAYGEGDELDLIEDLPSGGSSTQKRPDRPPRTGSNESASRASRTRTKHQIKPGLIKALGASSVTQKTVKGMRWNPKALRWEGNESALRDFDSVVQSSTRPALISQLTGSSTSSALASLSGYSSPVLQDSSSLITNIACGVKMVGDMIFDPIQMKWIHRNCEEDAEVFAQFEEEGFSSESGSGQPNRQIGPLGSEMTSSATLGSLGSDHGSEAFNDVLSWDIESTVRARKMRSGALAGRLEDRFAPASSDSSRLPRSPGLRTVRLVTKAEAAISHAIKTGTVPELDNVDEALWGACLEAEARHRAEMQSFLPRSPAPSRKTDVAVLDYAPTLEEIERPRPHLHYLQKLARRLDKGGTPMSPSSHGA